MSKVSRSVYQKVCEENKKLKKDLRVICADDEWSAIEVFRVMDKWSDYFAEEDRFRNMVREAIRGDKK